MKKVLFFFVVSMLLHLSSSSQSAGDYRSINSGIWHDATIWEIFDGMNWISTSTFPGQEKASGEVTILEETKIKLTANLPYAIAGLLIEGRTYCIDCPWEQPPPTFGTLSFSSEAALSLAILGDVRVFGELRLENQRGWNTHSLSIGGSLTVGGDSYWEYYYYDYYLHQTPTVFQTVNHDEKLKIIFNTTLPYSVIHVGYGVTGIIFQDVTFDGIGIRVNGEFLLQHASFINGIIETDAYDVVFVDDASFTGASDASFVNGAVIKRGDDSFVFPVGRVVYGFGGVYAPVAISTPGVFDTLVARSSYNTSESNTISDPGLHSISNCEFWILHRWDASNSNLNYSLNVTVGWNTSDPCGALNIIENVSDVTLAMSESETFTSHGGSGIGTTANGSVTWYGLNKLGSYFRLANMNSDCVPPTQLNVNNITSNSAQLSWPAVGSALNYDVDYKLATSCCWINVASAITSTSLALLGLEPSLNYDWRVRAHCSSQRSAYRKSQFSTMPATCAAPTELTATNITANSVTLNWNAVAGALNYSVQYRPYSIGTWTTVVSGTAALSCNLGGLTANRSYEWKVSANCSGNSISTFIAAPPPVCNDLYEANNTSGQAINISIDNAISAGITSNWDVDWFKVTTPNSSNTILEVTLSNLSADYDLYVYNNKNQVLVGASTNMATANEVVTFNSNVRKATYYIKVIGKDGAYNASQCYSLIVRVSNNARTISSNLIPTNEVIEETTNQLLYPNPASEFVYMHFKSSIEGASDIQVLNTVGQLVKRYSITIASGNNQFRIPVNDIRPGAYLLKINKGELNVRRTFVIKR